MVPHTDTSDRTEAGGGDRTWVVVVAVAAVLVLLYSLLVVQQFLLGVLVVLLLVGLGLSVEALRRFAGAYRRRTEAMEAIADSLAAMAETDRDPVDQVDRE